MKYYMLLIFVGVNFFSQNKINIEQQCKSQHDSVFKDFFGDKFFTNNIRFDKDEYFLAADTTDINSDDFNTSKIIYLNMNNVKLLEKLYHNKNFNYNEYYNYSFLYKGEPFQQITYTCEFINKKEKLDYGNKKIIDYYNKIKNKEYLSPQKAVRIAKANGLKNICYQSLTFASFYNRNQDVWQIQDCSSEKKTKVIELNPKTGKVLNIYERNYGKGEKAAYWNLFKSKDKEGAK
ncbi:MAG: hypothetical protein RR500_06740 [Bacilli bacterium]